MRRSFVRRFAWSTLLIGFQACAPSGASRAAGSPDSITRAEITASNASNAYELISRLRPNWLKQTSPGSISGGVRSQAVLVYLDGSPFGDPVSLRTLGISNLQSLQWLDPARAATVLPGMTSEPIAGAIVIKTR